jgi:predicted signal transduction protein with EAL and GGDEF domain
VTCSTGVATFPVDGHDARTVLEAADRACYVAKRDGDRVATAAEALAVAADFSPTSPTPVDVPTLLEPTGS